MSNTMNDLIAVIEELRSGKIEAPTGIFDISEVFHKIEELHPDLVDRVFDQTFGKVIHHPLIISTMHDSRMNAMVNAQYLHRKAAAAKALAEQQWERFVMLHERPYRLDAFLALTHSYSLPIFKQRQRYGLLARIWIDSENIHESLSEWGELWKNTKPNSLLMNRSEVLAFKALSDQITVYRGLNANEGELRGMSWTTDLTKAQWFAQRWNTKPTSLPTVATAKVDKNEVRAYFLRRGESEIVLHTDYVNELDIETEEI